MEDEVSQRVDEGAIPQHIKECIVEVTVRESMDGHVQWYKVLMVLYTYDKWSPYKKV